MAIYFGKKCSSEVKLNFISTYYVIVNTHSGYIYIYILTATSIYTHLLISCNILCRTMP